jgi:type II secretory pathway pseudopilin PulG
MGDAPDPFSQWGKPPPGVASAPAPPPQPSRRSPRPLIAALAIVAAVAGALIVTLGASGSGSSSTTALRGRAFTTAYPDGWTVTIRHRSAEDITYVLTSSAARTNDLGIPPAGAIGITIDDYSLEAVSAIDPAAAATVSQDPLALLPAFIGTPRTAVDEVSSVALHTTTLGAAAAAAASYTYIYNGVSDVQSDVVSRHGQQIATIELNTEPALASQGTAALNAVAAHWRWAGHGGVKPAAPAKLRYTYAAGLQIGFLNGCDRGGRPAVCQCALRYFEARVPVNGFMNYATATAGGRHPATPQWATDALQACVAVGSASATPGSQTESTQDAAAEELARTAQVAIETLATDNNGSYASANSGPSALQAYESTIQTIPGGGRAYLSAVVATSDSYSVTSTSTSGDTFSVKRSSTGALTSTCTPSHGTRGNCVNGSW